MQQFRPDVKPPRWGGRAEVEFALRMNCERLGLPMPLAWSPMWGKDFGDTLVGSVRPGANGYEITATASSGYVAIPVPAINLDSATVFYVGNMVAWAQYQSILGSSVTNYISIANDGSSPTRITVAFGGATVTGYHYLNYSDLPFVTGGSWAWAGTCIGTKHTHLSIGWPSQRVIRHETTHPRSNFNLANASDFRMQGGAGAAGRAPSTFYLWPTFANKHIVDQLHYQPHILLMPVARPVYFDMGASTADALTATDLITGSPVLGTPALGQVHALTATGITTSSPVLGTPALGQVHELTATALTVSSPVLGTPAVGQVHSLAASVLVVGPPVLGAPALSENAPDVDALTANDLVVGSPVLGTPSLGQIHVLGSDGLVTGAPVLGSQSITQIHTLATLGLTVGVPVLGTPALTSGAIAPITAAEVARTVRATARMKTVAALARKRTVVYEIS